VAEVLGEGDYGIVKACRWQNRPYALKMLKPDLDDAHFRVGASDLWKEAEFLASLKHPHIIELHAKSFSVEALEKNFILFKPLEQSLHSKMKYWKTKAWTLAVTKNPEKRLAHLKARLQVALHIAEALLYLHHHDIFFVI
jgi:serine/threonine protein kinase